MSNSCEDIRFHDFSSRDRLFPDVNFWLYVYGENAPDSNEVKTYSSALKYIEEVQSELFTNVTVISEFVNRYMKKAWEIHYKNCSGDEYNQFKRSPEFVLVAKDAGQTARLILGKTQTVEIGFGTNVVADLLVAIEQGVRDFNDQIICEVCLQHQLTLITHDRDFLGCSVHVLTANKNLLH